MTTTLTPERRAVVARVEENLLTGRHFDLVAQSARSVPLGAPPINHRDWARIMQTIANFAAASDRDAATAFALFGKINLYLTPNEVIAQVAEGLAKVVREGYFDVIGATGPGAGPRSSYQYPTTLSEAIWLSLLLVEVQMNAGYLGHVPSLGWALSSIIERENVRVPAAVFPKVAASLAERSGR